MNLGKESEVLEFKKSTSEIEEGIVSLVAMLNKHGEGTLYFGVKNNGDVIGQKQINENTLRDVSRKISEKIKPQIIPHISLELLDDKEVIKVFVKGRDIPYTAFGIYYSRSFDEDKKLAPNEIKALINFDGEPDRTYIIESDNKEVIKLNSLNLSEINVLELMKNNPNITQKEITQILGLNIRTIGYIISS